MSKKQSEFDRYDRMRKMERESEHQKRKASDLREMSSPRKTARQKAPKERANALVMADEQD